MTEEIRLGDRVQMRKAHPCGSMEWTVIRIGADIKIKCLGCGRIVMLDRAEFVKRRKKVLEKGPLSEEECLRELYHIQKEDEENERISTESGNAEPGR